MTEPSTTAEQRRAENDRRVAANIQKFGCHVVSVFDPDGRHPTFSYSIGIQARTGAPEVIVIGLSPTLGHSLVNEYNRRVRDGGQLPRGRPQAGFLEGFDVYVEPARPERLGEYTLGCDRYYQGEPYRVVQIVYPTTKGAWPWQKAASDAFRAGQPMLGRKRPDRP